jgi:Domain of unknown function (DUF4382)
MPSRSSPTTSPRNRRLIGVSLTALAALALAGCGNTQGPSGTTSLSVVLKDAPGDLQKAVVTISEIDLVGSGGVQVLMQTPTTTDLLTLATNTATLVQGAEVPSGTYTELRFKITGACIAVDNGAQPSLIYATTGYDATQCGSGTPGLLQAPSYAQSGLKVTMAANALALTGTQKILLVDFDVSQSFGQQAGGSGGWVMHPVVTGGDIQATGSLHTSVQLGSGVTLPNAATLDQLSAVLVSGASDTVGVVALSDSAGTPVFTADFTFLTPASYTLSLKLPSTVASVTTNPATPEAVTITSGQQTTAALTVTAAN